MAIEFPCPHCTQLLRVGDDTGGKTAKCPQCNGLAKIPGGESLSLFGGSPHNKNPFSDGGVSGPASSQPAAGTKEVNPYSSPMTAYQAPPEQAPIIPQAVGVEPILDYSWQLWKQHLVLLVGVTITLLVIPNAISLLLFVPQLILAQNGEHRAAWMVWNVSLILSNIAQLYLAIGEKQILLRLARRQPAKFSELFGGAPLFLPVLGASLLFSLALLLGLLLLIAPGIVVIVIWWSSLSFVVDRKSGVLESFSLAAKISQNNWGTTLILVLMSISIPILGCMVLCIGFLFALPLVSLLWTVAYLMMSGQIPQNSAYGPIAAEQPVA
jgi:uncharacterized membrane protein